MIDDRAPCRVLGGWSAQRTLPIFLVAATASAGQGPDVPPPNFKIAFFGDQGLGTNARQVLELVAAEGADAVLHLGDFDYEDDPAAWNSQINQVLGPGFPYLAVVGNHDEDMFHGANGYQSYISARMKALGIEWEGDLGVKSTFRYQGIFFVLTAPGLFGNGDTVYAPYIRQRLAADDSIWRISGWHVLMNKMQVGEKDDESGWGVYEESRRGGAIIATAHEHSYARTHPLTSCQDQVTAGTQNHFSLEQDNPNTSADEGVSFAFHSGLGGSSIRDQARCFPVSPPYGCNGEWAKIYTADQNANDGALFGVFNYQGNPCEARFYFKNVDGQVVDQFFVSSTLGPCGGGPVACGEGDYTGADGGDWSDPDNWSGGVAPDSDTIAKVTGKSVRV